jgi:TonB family protein
MMGQSKDIPPTDSLYARDIRVVRSYIPDMVVNDIDNPDNVTREIYFNLGSIYIDYPEQDKENDIEGTVYCRFLIDTLGYIKHIKVIQGVTDRMNNEVVKALNELALEPLHAFPPGIKRKVIYQKVSMKFSLEDPEHRLMWWDGRPQYDSRNLPQRR